MELPLEADGGLLLSTLVAQFPGASGIKYRSASNSPAFRGVRLLHGIFHLPQDGANNVFICVFPKGQSVNFWVIVFSLPLTAHFDIPIWIFIEERIARSSICYQPTCQSPSWCLKRK